MPEQDLKELEAFLNKVGPGKIQDISALEKLLFRCWDDLDGSHEEKMNRWKLKSRIEEPCWEPPTLSFTIERHGQTKVGSTRASLQEWAVNLVRRSVDGGTTERYRQVDQRASPLKVEPLAEKVVALVTAGENSEWLEWREDRRRVRILVGKIIPDVVAKQTLIGRRKRFRLALQKRMRKEGWNEVEGTRYHTYEYQGQK